MAGEVGAHSGETLARSVFEELDIRPIINAAGIYTDLGGSILSDRIWSQLTELNSAYVDLNELLSRTGSIVAELVGAEAARIIPGASAGLALAAAAAMTGDDGRRWEQLPDTSGMPAEIVLQSAQARQYQYSNPIRLAGAKLVFAGSNAGASSDDIRTALSERTAAIVVPAHLDHLDGIVKLGDIAKIAHEHGVPLIVDAAYQVYPPAKLHEYVELGADLTVVSSKYMAGPNAGGFLYGKKALVDVVAGLDFTRFESGPYRTFGRPFKMGRYEIAAVCLALREWFTIDHPQRLAGYERMARTIADGIEAFPGCNAKPCGFTLDERIVQDPINAVLVSFDKAGSSAPTVIELLGTGAQPIFVVPRDDDILIVTETLRPGDAEVLVRRFGQAVEALS